jgi:tRNA threonylcarbamoyladenosine biosynthesis protein TsaB
MNILALEFSSPVRSVAIVECRDGQERVRVEIADRDFRARGAVALVQDALSGAGLKPEAIDRIAVGLGPGSYTGIRSAISIAQGWQLGLNTGVVGVGSFDILAATALVAGAKDRARLVVDAQRNEVYSVVYDLSGQFPHAVDPIAIAPAASLSGQPIVGPEATRWSLVARDLLPSAIVLARLAHASSVTIPAEKLEPIYLRPVEFVKAPPARLIP